MFCDRDSMKQATVAKYTFIRDNLRFNLNELL